MKRVKFYEVGDIEKKLICGHCKLILDAFSLPKMLPCGNTICQSSENEIWKDDQEEYQCDLCGTKHKKPSEGFPVNQLVKNLCEIKPKTVYRGELYEATSNKVDKLAKDVNSLKEDFENTSKKIHNYCDSIRNEIDTSVENKKNQLNTLRDSLVKQIDDYEKTCVRHSDEALIRSEDIKKAIDESNDKINSWITQLQRVDLTDKDIKAIAENTDALEQSINTKRQILDQMTFFGQPLEFKHSTVDLNQSHIGELRGTKVSNLNSERINATTALNINYKAGSLTSQSSVAAINDDKFLIAYLVYLYDTYSDSYMYQVKLRLFKRNGDILSEVTEQHSSQNVQCLNVVASKDAVYLVLQDQFNRFWLRSYDVDLIEKGSAKLDYVPTAVHTNDGEVFVISNTKPLVHVYDNNLKELKSFGQSDNSNDPYFIKKSGEFSFKSDIMFVYDGKNVDLILKDSGKVLKTVSTNKTDCLFQTDSNMNIILLNKQNKVLSIFDWNANLIDEFTVKAAKSVSSFVVSDGGYLLANDRDSGIMTIY